MNLRAVKIASFVGLSALIFIGLKLTAGSHNDYMAMAFDHHPLKTPYLCVAKPRTVKPLV